MSNLLPIGTVVRLHNGTIDVMIIGRFPLYNQEGTIGYFDYVACLYPTGVANEELLYFNQENIEKMIFEGYHSKKEDELQELFKNQKDSIKYPKLKV